MKMAMFFMLRPGFASYFANGASGNQPTQTVTTVPSEQATTTPTSTPTATVAPQTKFTSEKGVAVTITSPSNMQKLSPCSLGVSTLKGHITGSWYFEGSFPVKLLDENGNVVSTLVAQSSGNWMTSNQVNFSAVLTCETGNCPEKGTIVLEKDDPSGLAANADKISIPFLVDNTINCE
jgi:hypothetical protein